MVAVSLDLRLRILCACDLEDQTREETAETFGVSRSFVQKLVRLDDRVQRETVNLVRHKAENRTQIEGAKKTLELREEDYKLIRQAETKSEYIGGEVLPMPGASMNHVEISAQALTELRQQLPCRFDPLEPIQGQLFAARRRKRRKENQKLFGRAGAGGLGPQSGCLPARAEQSRLVPTRRALRPLWHPDRRCRAAV